MRRLLPLLTVLLLAACTPADVARLLLGRELPPESPEYVFAADPGDPALSPETLEQAAAVIERRLDLLGVPAEVVIAGDHFIGVTTTLIDGSAGDLGDILTRPGRVEFADLRNAPPELTAAPNDALLATSAHPTGGEHIDPVTGAPYLTVLDAVQIVDAQATASQFSNAWDITLQFSAEHGAKLADYTAANIGTTMGILIDGRLLSAPRIQTQVGDEALIAGNFTQEDARKLAAVIGGGTLPLSLTLAETR